MNKQDNRITASEARVLAVNAAKPRWVAEVGNTARPFLEDSFIEAQHCWMFFRNRDIAVAPERALADEAYVVSKRGTVRTVVNYIDDQKEAANYLQKMSDYFATNNM
jgi:hypothetical protein